MSQDKEMQGELASLRALVEQLQLRLKDVEGRAAAQDQHAGNAAVLPVPVPKLEPQPLPSRMLLPTVEAVHMSATRVVMQQLVMPSDCDSMYICKGGQVLSWIDLCAGLSAKMLAKAPCVTASVDTVHFLRPCRLGMVVIISAMVNRTFDSSMEVGVRVETEEMRTGQRHHSCSAHLTFVTCGQRQNGVKAKLPRILVTTQEQVAIFDSALDRRQERLLQRSLVKADPALAAAQDLCRLQPVTHRVGGTTVPPAPLLQTFDSAVCVPLAMDGAPACQLHNSSPLGSHPTEVQLAPPSGPDALSQTAQVQDPQAGQQQQQQQQQQHKEEEEQQRSEQQQRQQQQQDLENQEELSLLREASGDYGVVTASPFGSLVLPQRMAVLPGMTVAYMTQSILPGHANTLSITFGGQVMSWMEECSYIAASRLRGHDHALTACLDSVAFIKPTRVGDIMYITAQVSATFGSSLEVMISVHGEDPSIGEVFHCADAFLTLVTVDAKGSPMPVPCDLMPSSQAEQLRLKGAILRRAARLRLRKDFEASEMDDAGTLQMDLALV